MNDKKSKKDNTDDQDDVISRPRFLVIGDMVFSSMDSLVDFRSYKEIMEEEGWLEIVSDADREMAEQNKEKLAEMERNFRERLKKLVEESRRKNKEKE